MVLNGWKDIAEYLNCSVRSAQRWERNGLPLVRPENGPRGSVLVYSEQLDSWLKNSRSNFLSGTQPREQMRQNVRLAGQLRTGLREARLELASRVKDLQASLRPR